MLTDSNNRYSHLYKTVQYVPPSVIRKMENATPSQNQVYSNVNTNIGSVMSAGGQGRMDYLLNSTLRNRDIYSDMKNKIMYSLSQDVAIHSSLNQL